MSGLHESITTWTRERIDAMLSAPRMWGSLEAVELQVLQLLELHDHVLGPSRKTDEPRRVLDSYMQFLRTRYPTQTSDPLFRLVGDGGEREFVTALRSFRDMLAMTTLVENPFEHSELAIKLTFDVGKHPSTSLFTGYYEEFRRAARAVARTRGKSTGRAKKDIERATDFTLEDATVSPPNGACGEVLLRLGPGGGQKDWAADERVRDALSAIFTLAEWASANSDVSDLRIDDLELRMRTAVQARRLVPRRGIKTVAVGGKLVARPKPIEICAEHERRFLEVVSQVAAPEPFDECDEVRAIDLDRGVLVLGKSNRTQCFISRDLLGEPALVGVNARVIGARYRPPTGRSFVLVEQLDIDESTFVD